jgi:hypothetical protein
MDPWIGISIAAPMKIFSFDAETDGLYGPVWAIGAVVSEEPNAEGTVFAGRIEPTDEVVTDSWVRDNIVPYGLESHWSFREFSSREDLLNAFWDFWIEHCNDALVLADCVLRLRLGYSELVSSSTSRTGSGNVQSHFMSWPPHSCSLAMTRGKQTVESCQAKRSWFNTIQSMMRSPLLSAGRRSRLRSSLRALKQETESRQLA